MHNVRSKLCTRTIRFVSSSRYVLCVGVRSTVYIKFGCCGSTAEERVYGAADGAGDGTLSHLSRISTATGNEQRERERESV